MSNRISSTPSERHISSNFRTGYVTKNVQESDRFHTPVSLSENALLDAKGHSLAWRDKSITHKSLLVSRMTIRRFRWVVNTTRFVRNEIRIFITKNIWNKLHSSCLEISLCPSSWRGFQRAGVKRKRVLHSLRHGRTPSRVSVVRTQSGKWRRIWSK